MSETQEHYCSVCHRPESVTGRQLDMGGMYICMDCMQRTIDVMSSSGFNLTNMMNNMPPNMVNDLTSGISAGSTEGGDNKEKGSGESKDSKTEEAGRQNGFDPFSFFKLRTGQGQGQQTKEDDDPPLKLSDVPYGKFRDKGTPIDNLCNYDSKKETFIQVFALKQILDTELLFVTKTGMAKRVSGSDFDVSRRTIQSTRLADGDEIVFIRMADEKDQIVLRTKMSYLLRLKVTDIPVQKKAAAGVHAIRLGDSDEVEECYLLTGGTDLGTGTDPASEIEMNGKKVALNRLRIAGRGTRGTKR